MPLMTLSAVSRRFELGRGLFAARRTLQAVADVDLTVERGEVLAIVGESGCGKSTLARMMLGLLAPSAGSIRFEDQDLGDFSRRDFARHVQPVFQDPYASLNPRQRVADIVSLPLRTQGLADARQRRERVMDMLARVGLSARHADSFPMQLSGGQRQRVAIARALVGDPQMLICDEPTSALDVSVQAQILNLLQALRGQGARTYVLISHNLAVVRHLATRVAVMYLGRIVELADTAVLFSDPRHPYTRALLASVLPARPGHGIPDTGLGIGFPDPSAPPPGCAFHPRCPVAMARCASVAPPGVAGVGRFVSCHLHTAGVGLQQEE